MATSKQPYTLPLSHRGYIQGLTISNTDTNRPLCHYFGGLRYAFPPPQRWRRAIPLPADYSYGSKEQPGVCQGSAGVCPQPAFMGPPDMTGWTEDCFQVNVYVPVGKAPEGGWPVLFYIHGGWLQAGTPNTFDAAALVGESPVRAIVVMPAYRLNVFGFLYASELEHDAASAGEASTGNHGFWDQRTALEWTKGNINLFGGDSGNITISGYSAGAYSVFHQLSHDLRLPDHNSIIKQAAMWSNSPAVQPKSPREAQTQFTQLLNHLQIPPTLTPQEILTRLRAIPGPDLLNAATSISLHQYRPTTDEIFISATLFQSLDDGSFAQKLAKRGIRLLLGETRDEPTLYSLWFPPAHNTLQSLHERLYAEYPRPAVNALIPLYYPTFKLPADCKNWDKEAYGKIYADMQVYKMQRGFIHALLEGGMPSDMLYRYRMEFRLQCVEKYMPVEWGVTHATDHYLWFWGKGEVISDWEKSVIGNAFLGPLGEFVKGGKGGKGKDIGWGSTDIKQMRTLKPDGNVVFWEDELWDDAVRVWKAVREAKDDVAKL